MAEQPDLERLIILIRRELGASEVIVCDPHEVPAETRDGELIVGLTASAQAKAGALRVRFAVPPDDLDARRRRLEMLVTSFPNLLASVRVAPSRGDPAESLHEVLQELAEGAAALDAIVIDAQSPVTWGSAAKTERPSLVPQAIVIDLSAVRLDPEHRGSRAHMDAAKDPRDIWVEQAIEHVRALPVISNLHRGGHLHHCLREDTLGYVARSFASIYVAIVVFDALFDELRAERALTLALPRIERLVAALPPLDPTPEANIMAIRRPQRR